MYQEKYGVLYDSLYIDDILLTRKDLRCQMKPTIGYPPFVK